MRRLCEIVAALAASPLAAAQQGASHTTFQMQELAPGVLAAEVVADPPHYAFANSLIVDLGGGLLIVDTQQSPDAAAALIAELARRDLPPVRWVVNTHWHGDHVLGNAAYRDRFPDVQIIGHRTHPEDFATRTRAQVAEDLARLPLSIAEAQAWLDAETGPDGTPLTTDQRRRLGQSLELRRNQLAVLQRLELVPPMLLLHDVLELRGPNRTVEIRWMGPAHTRGDLVVWLPGERILAAGDLIEDAWPWVEDADLQGWMRALEQMAALEPRVVLPGHGVAWSEPVTRLHAQAALFRSALDTGCAESPGSPPVPATLRSFRDALGLSPAGEAEFWRVLLAVARTGIACRSG